MAGDPHDPSESLVTEQELRQLAHTWFQVALATRCAMRALPAAAASGDFTVWGDPPCAAQHVRAIEATIAAAALASVTGTLTPHHSVIYALMQRACRAANQSGYAAGAAENLARAAESLIEASKPNVVSTAQRSRRCMELASQAVWCAIQASGLSGSVCGPARGTAPDAASAAARQDLGELTQIMASAGPRPSLAVPTRFYSRPLWGDSGSTGDWTPVQSSWTAAYCRIARVDQTMASDWRFGGSRFAKAREQRLLDDFLARHVNVPEG